MGNEQDVRKEKQAAQGKEKEMGDKEVRMTGNGI